MKPLAQQSLYEILDVPFDASAAVLAEAVARAQALYAPGSLATYTLMDPEDEQLLSRRIEEARATLLDPMARARYDERLTGPEPILREAEPPVPPTPPVIDAAIRTAWPELPPVIPAARPPAGDEWQEDVPVPPVLPAAEPTPAPVRPAEPVPAPPLAVPAAPPPAAPRSMPILLSREVTPPAAGPALTPVPGTAAAAPPPLVVSDTTVWSGEVLRQLREARGISLPQISERTKVTRHHIENIEADRFELLPASVYLRGILMSISRELRLDGQKVARSYLDRVSAACTATSPIPRQR